MLPRVLLSLAVAGSLTACSGISVVESQVTAYSTWANQVGQTVQPTGPAPTQPAPAPVATGPVPLPVGATWRFERLPSQQMQAPIQLRFESFVQPLLERAGWRRDDAAPRFLVQLAVRSQREDPLPWRGPWGPGLRRGFGWGGAAYSAPHFDREVMVLIREVASNQVVFETHAVQESGWSDSDAVWSAMMAAALHEFPNPPIGTRRIGVQVPL